MATSRSDVVKKALYSNYCYRKKKKRTCQMLTNCYNLSEKSQVSKEKQIRKLEKP